jgi:hypothetical protein
MATIVEYSDPQLPENRYPHQIISPPRSGPCCLAEMEWLRTPREEINPHAATHRLRVDRTLQ